MPPVPLGSKDLRDPHGSETGDHHPKRRLRQHLVPPFLFLPRLLVLWARGCLHFRFRGRGWRQRLLNLRRRPPLELGRGSFHRRSALDFRAPRLRFQGFLDLVRWIGGVESGYELLRIRPERRGTRGRRMAREDG